MGLLAAQQVNDAAITVLALRFLRLGCVMGRELTRPAQYLGQSHLHAEDEGF